ncbi:hypothetical protein FA95DRAFT_1682532 [Auriscalpium vulgare]|uniref:Uncharacterized protein n=1 Tax=Auriscalpium vulgare TaxID=40419 RepID=A0ACB8REY9_9AGAM|nr:hypothetical protein FA95DRAFT_1682532 [Auriscalpium vulgare]
MPALPLAPPRTNGRPAVLLSQLKSLKIDGIMKPTAQFLEYVRAPNCTKLCLALEAHLQPEDEIRESCNRVTAWTHANCPFVPQAVRLTTLNHGGTELWDLRVEAFRRVEDAPLAERGEMIEEEGDYDLARMCYDAVASAQLQETVLDVVRWEPSAWKDTANSAVALKRLFVAEDAVWTFVERLHQLSSSRARRARQLGGLYLDESVEISDRRTYGGALCDWLHERVDEGCSIADLTFFHCDGDAAYLDMLRAVPGLVVHNKER